MPFQKGKPRAATAGRRKGTPNKQAGAEIIARRIVEDEEYQKNLLLRARAGDLAPAVETMLSHYLYSRAAESVRDEEQLTTASLEVLDKHAGSSEAQQEIRQAIEAYKAGGSPLRAVA